MALSQRLLNCVTVLLGLTLLLMVGGMVLFQATETPPVLRREAVTPEPTRAEQEPAPGLAPVFTEEVRYWEAQILAWSRTYGLDPNLIATVMQIESCGYLKARSPAGALGLFQVMPYHFEPDEDPFDPETNARRGLGYLRQAWERAQGDVRLALAAYNGGMKRLQEPESAWPRETQRYVRWGTAIYQDALAGRARSPALEEWLEAGGWWLCQQARLFQTLD